MPPLKKHRKGRVMTETNEQPSTGFFSAGNNAEQARVRHLPPFASMHQGGSRSTNFDQSNTDLEFGQVVRCIAERKFGV